jgi:hypothetical protein
MTILDEIQTSIRQHAEGSGTSVVGIGQRWGLGSGIVLAEGRVLTNAHNVRGDQVTVTFADGRTAEGRTSTATSPSSRSTQAAFRRWRGPTAHPPRSGRRCSPCPTPAGAGCA